MIFCTVLSGVYLSLDRFNSLQRGNIKGLGHTRRCDGLVVSARDFGSRGSGLSPGWGHCVVFLGKTLYSHSASLHPGV